MGIMELSLSEIGQRIRVILSNYSGFILDLYAKRYSEFINAAKAGFGKWYQLQRNNKLFEFVYFFNIEGAKEEYLKFFIQNKELIEKILYEVARQVMLYIERYSRTKISLSGRAEIIFTMRSAGASIHPSAFLDINANEWLFNIISAYKNNDRGGFFYHLHRLISSIIHELEHSPFIDKSLGKVHEDKEELTTFVEYLSLPMGVVGRHEKEYLPRVREYQLYNKKGKNHSHACRFYMSLIIFVDYIKNKPEFLSDEELQNFPVLDLNEQFEFLINFRKHMAKNKSSFIKYGLECRELLYRTETSRNFFARFKEAEARLRVKKKLFSNIDEWLNL